MILKKRAILFLLFASLLQITYVNCAPSNVAGHDEQGVDTVSGIPGEANEENIAFKSDLAVKPLPEGASVHSTANEIFAKGRILVRANPDATSEEIDSELAKHGAKRIEKLRGLEIHVVELPENANEKAVAALLAHNPKFKFAEVDRMTPANFLTNDPSLSSQWGIHKVQGPAAWDKVDGAGVTIAILDSGVNINHPDLIANMVPGWNMYDNNSDLTDVTGHGTAVAGVAAAAGNNGLGVSGLAFKASIMPIRISDTAGYALYSRTANAITWAADRGAKVVNVSYGVICSSAVQSAGAYLMNKGGVLVISAGNENASITCGVSNVVLVSATDSSDQRASFSNYGSAVTISAPGVGILTTNRAGGYSNWNGTSFSAPMTAGVLALMKQANPNLTAVQMISLLRQSSDDLGAAGSDMYFGAGRINAARAVAMATSTVVSPTPSPTPAPTPSPAPAPTPAPVTISDTIAPQVRILSPSAGSTLGKNLSIQGSATDNIGVTAMSVYVDGVLKGTSTTGSIKVGFNTRSLSVGLHTIRIEARDAKGNVGTASVQVSK